ncbi:MAG: nucleotidyl transferase AbiEii/AbiGii toxin family protein [Alphaproteobacteria bacterium]|nr:nucleotidyl transferase AbiEii/AbiGii toxin family protein [Alphaproteobacteria bacterium]
MLTPRLDILPAPQAKLWPDLARLPPHFVLYGGTAIALRLGHRVSVDFDLFSDVELDDKGKDHILSLFDGAVVLLNERDTLTFITPVDGQPVKLSFFGRLTNGCVAEPDATDDGVACVASLDDLLAHKLKVIHDRAEGKDYQDIAVMLMRGRSLARSRRTRRAPT